MTLKTRYFHLLLILLVLGMTTSGLLMAQDDVPPVFPDAEDAAAQADAAARLSVIEAEWQREFDRRRPTDFRVAYLIAPQALPAESPLSSENVASTTGAQIFGDWKAFAAQNEEQPFQIVLIHESMVDQVDVAVTQAAYRSQTLLMGVGVSFPQWVEITGDFCAEEPNPAYRQLADEMILMFSYVYEVSDEALVPRIHEVYLEQCVPEDDITVELLGGDALAGDWAIVTRGKANMLFSDFARVPDAFARMLISETISYGIEPLEQ